MNDLNQSIEDVRKEARVMPRECLIDLVVSLNAGNLAKQQYIEGLEDLITKLKEKGTHIA